MTKKKNPSWILLLLRTPVRRRVLTGADVENLQARTLTSFGQVPKKEAPVGVLSEDRLAPGAAVHQVVPAPRIIKSWFTCYRYCNRSSVDWTNPPAAGESATTHLV